MQKNEKNDKKPQSLQSNFYKSNNFKIIDNYAFSLKDILGTGSFGSVYRGINMISKEQIAIKQVNFYFDTKSEEKIQKLITSLKNEVKNMRTINHPNVVKLYDVKKSSNNFYLICEYCNNGNLENYLLSRQNKLSLLESIKIMKEIVSGCYILYYNNIVHRDLKPANILLHNLQCKIADFGFSKMVDSMEEKQILSQVGSPLYMSPQILRGDNYSSKTDIWSLGIIFFQMIFGKPPWIGKTPYHLLKCIENENIDFQLEKNNDIILLLKNMLEINEDKRISWEELFNHDIFVKDKIKADLEQSLRYLENEYQQDKFLKQKSLNQIFFEKNKIVTNPFPNEIQNFSFQKKDSNSNLSPDKNTINYENLYNLEFFIKDQLKKEEELSKILLISQWILHKRNKSVFLNVICIKMIDLAINNIIKIKTEIYFRFVFLTMKYQMMILYKCYTRLKTEENDNYKHFSKEDWNIFNKSEPKSFLFQCLKDDITVVKGFFDECLERTNIYLKKKLNSIKSTSSSQILPEIILKLKKLKEITNNNLGDKTIFLKAFYETTQDLYDYLLNSKQHNQEIRFLLNGLDKINEFKTNFKWNPTKIIDFYKIYELLANND